MKSLTLAFIAICMIAVLIHAAEGNDMRQRGRQGVDGVRGRPSRGFQPDGGGPPGNPGAPGRGPPPPGAPGGPPGPPGGPPPMPGKPEHGSGEGATTAAS